MKHCDREGWLCVLSQILSGIFPRIGHILILVAAYSAFVYVLKHNYDVVLATTGHSIFGSTVVYLLVFRLMASCNRYQESRAAIMDMFHVLRQFVMVGCVCMKGGRAASAWREHRASPHQLTPLQDEDDACASTARINLIRLTLASAIAVRLQVHMSTCCSGNVASKDKMVIDWARIRLRGLVTRQEFEMLNDLVPIHGELHVTRGAQQLTSEQLEDLFSDREHFGRAFLIDKTPEMKISTALVSKMRMEVMSQFGSPWGLRNSCRAEILSCCEGVSSIQERIDDIACSVVPLSYVHLCRMLVFWLVLVTPIVVDPSLGFFVNVSVPVVIALVILGIDAISSELEAPFSDALGDVGWLTPIATLESEFLKVLELCGDQTALDAFDFFDVTDLQKGDDCVPLRFLCLRTQIRMPSRTPDETKVFSVSPEFTEPSEAPEPQKLPPMLRVPDVTVTEAFGGPESPSNFAERSTSQAFHPMMCSGPDEVELTGSEDGAGQDCVGLSEAEEDDQSFRAGEVPDSRFEVAGPQRSEDENSLVGLTSMPLFTKSGIIQLPEKSNDGSSASVNDVCGLSEESLEENKSGFGPVVRDYSRDVVVRDALVDPVARYASEGFVAQDDSYDPVKRDDSEGVREASDGSSERDESEASLASEDYESSEQPLESAS